MTPERFQSITAKYAGLRVAVVGDFCLDRYLEIDPARSETSIETGLPVYNVVRVRSEPGAAGTILNNLVALGVGEIFPIGFCGDDGEGYELRRALQALSGVNLEHFLTTDSRRTFVYCKPLVMEPQKTPRELNRLDSKNWTATPANLQRDLAERICRLAWAGKVDAVILLDQVDLAETGVVTEAVREAVQGVLTQRPELVTLADSRRGLQGFPPLGFKMNSAELGRMAGAATVELEAVRRQAADMARRNGQPVFVTLAERGIVGARPEGLPEHVPSHPVRGEIDIVGAGDSVTANLATALAARAELREAMELAMAAASLVIHQVGTTGTASVGQMRELLFVGKQ